MKINNRSDNSERGFTIIEVVVAGFVLVIGVLGVVLMANSANAVTDTTKAREGSTNLVRELLEQSRGLSYGDLTSAQATSDLQNGGYPDADAGQTGWQLRHRGILFSVTLSACTFDDAHDGARASGAAGTFCPGSVAEGSTSNTDANPDDYRRVEVAVTWTLNGKPANCAGLGGTATGPGVACVNQAEMIANPSGGLGPSIKTITPASDPVESGTSVRFDVITESASDALSWDSDDGQTGTGTATPNSNALGWFFIWSFQGPAPTNSGVATPPAGGNVFDGTHTVDAQAFLLDAAGIAKPRTVGLNRYLPRAPSVPTPNGGVNDRLTAQQPIVELSWQQNPDTDIWGYQVYRAINPPSYTLTGGTKDSPVCSTADVKATTCFDANPLSRAPTASECLPTMPVGDQCATYYVVAFDKPWATGNPSSSLSPCPPLAGTTTPLTVGIALPLATTAPLSNTSAAGDRRPGCPSQLITIDYTAGLANSGALVSASPPVASGQPTAPGSLSCSQSSTGLNQVSWTAPDASNPNNADIIRYRLYRDPASGGPPNGPAYAERSALLGSADTGYTDPTPPAGTAHTYYVTSVDSQFAESAVASITC